MPLAVHSATGAFFPVSMKTRLSPWPSVVKASGGVGIDAGVSARDFQGVERSIDGFLGELEGAEMHPDRVAGAECEIGIDRLQRRSNSMPPYARGPALAVSATRSGDDNRAVSNHP